MAKISGTPDVVAGGGGSSPYTGIPPSTATTIEEELDWRANHVGTISVITNAADLERLFPAVGGLHTIDTTAKFTAFDGLLPGNHLDVVFPGALTSDHSLSVLISGDYAGPLVSGEVAANGLAVLNVNAGGSDMELLSPLGRFMRAADCTFLGQGGVEVKSAGAVNLDKCVFQPAASGAAALSITATIGDMLIDGCIFTAPGGAPYTGITVAPTATILGELTTDLNAINTATSGDALFNISPSATLPGGGVRPATVAGLRLITSNVRGPGTLFAAGSLADGDIEVVASGGQGTAPDTRLLGDAFVKVAGADINLSFALVTPGVDAVVPASNGAGDTITLQGLSSHFTLDVSDINNWWLRYDGPDSNKNAAIVWAVDFLKSGAANNIIGVVYRDTGGGFIREDQSESAARLAPTALPARAEGRMPAIMSSGDRIQIRLSSDGTSAIDIDRIALIQEGLG